MVMEAVPEATVDSKKAFNTLHEAYRFFQDHSTEANHCADAIATQISTLYTSRPMQLLDFGCGEGKFLAAVIDRLGIDPKQLHVTLVEPDPTYLDKASQCLQEVVGSVTAHASIATVASQADIIVANHCLYYVSDLENTLHDCVRRLAPRGRMLATMAKSNNSIIILWRKLFGSLGIDVPFYVHENMTDELSRAEIEYSTCEINSALSFSRTTAAEKLILKFCLGEHMDKFDGLKSLSGIFDEYTRDGVVKMPLSDTLFALVRT